MVTAKKTKSVFALSKSFLTTEKLPIVYGPEHDSSKEGLIEWFLENQKEWTRDLSLYGAILIRGFDIKTPKDFEEVALATKDKLGQFYLGTSPRDQLTDYVFTASELPPHYPIMQHAEMSFLDNPPKKLFFFAEIASEFGGETPLTDLRKIYKVIDPSIKEKITKKGIRYRRRYDGPSSQSRFSLWKTKRWDEMFNTSDIKQVEAIAKENRFQLEWYGKDSLAITNTQSGFRNHPKLASTAWHNHTQTFHIDSAVIEVWKIFKRQKTLRSLGVALLLSAITWIKKLGNPKEFDVHVTYGDGEEFSKKEIESICNAFWDNLSAFRWQNGDVLIIDNFSVSHGRLPFTGNRRILVSWTA
ncbi:TauD/TfdA family dioxygenase [Leptospira idonii]|uniref:Taurine dioxygenase n=1 Tax=Leptospira idonii TaxID=1193500 RepID=A0A4R9M1G2_9LEPT|nr:TauD/TfdA family dioxygenase [Leptospira idonii]TGN20543.1 taurine dioxygenase [Leptospira idonii]